MATKIIKRSDAGPWTYLDVEIEVGGQSYCQTIIVPVTDVDQTLADYADAFISALLAIVEGV
jgi:hypothetical protein